MANEDPDYLTWVRRQSCLAYGAHVGTVQAHHAGERDTGDGALRAHDHTAVPLCLKHHAEWHGATGAFKGMDKAARKAWAERAIANVRSRPRGTPDWF